MTKGNCHDDHALGEMAEERCVLISDTVSALAFESEFSVNIKTLKQILRASSTQITIWNCSDCHHEWSTTCNRTSTPLPWLPAGHRGFPRPRIALASLGLPLHPFGCLSFPMIAMASLGLPRFLFVLCWLPFGYRSWVPQPRPNQ